MASMRTTIEELLTRDSIRTAAARLGADIRRLDATPPAPTGSSRRSATRHTPAREGPVRHTGESLYPHVRPQRPGHSGSMELRDDTAAPIDRTDRWNADEPTTQARTQAIADDPPLPVS